MITTTAPRPFVVGDREIASSALPTPTRPMLAHRSRTHTRRVSSQQSAATEGLTSHPFRPRDTTSSPTSPPEPHHFHQNNRARGHPSRSIASRSPIAAAAAASPTLLHQQAARRDTSRPKQATQQQQRDEQQQQQEEGTGGMPLLPSVAGAGGDVGVVSQPLSLSACLSARMGCSTYC